MERKIENKKIKEYLINMATDRLQNCDVFTRTFGKRFAKNRLRTNLCKVYTNEVNKKCRGYAVTKGKNASTITICCTTEMNEPLSVEQIAEDPEFESIALHEVIHIILEKTKRECKKTLIDSGTGILEVIRNGERGRGLNEGLTNWIVRKTGIATNSYQTLTNFMEELEVAIGEDNVMAMCKGNLSKSIPKLLKMNFGECLRIFAIGDEIYEIGNKMINDRIILDITEKYLIRNILESDDKKKVEKQYEKLIQTEAEEAFNNGKLSGKKFVELLKKSTGFGCDWDNKRLLSTVANLIAPNSINALYVQDLLLSLDFEQLENINKYKISISTYCAGNINIPVYIQNGKITSIFSPCYKESLPQMKITSENELKNENVMIFDYTSDLEDDGYTIAREEALQIYQEALNVDSTTKMKILDKMIVLENSEGIQMPYIISSEHVLPAFPQKGSTIDILLAPNEVKFPTVQKENVFSKLIIDIKRRILKNPKGDIYYNNESTTNEKSKIFRESVRFEEGEEAQLIVDESVTKQKETKIEASQLQNNGLPR